jgi:hypothetical protein
MSALRWLLAGADGAGQGAAVQAAVDDKAAPSGSPVGWIVLSLTLAAVTIAVAIWALRHGRSGRAPGGNDGDGGPGSGGEHDPSSHGSIGDRRWDLSDHDDPLEALHGVCQTLAADARTLTNARWSAVVVGHGHDDGVGEVVAYEGAEGFRRQAGVDESALLILVAQTIRTGVAVRRTDLGGTLVAVALSRGTHVVGALCVLDPHEDRYDAEATLSLLALQAGPIVAVALGPPPYAEPYPQPL